jgi:hypothetical protein
LLEHFDSGRDIALGLLAEFAVAYAAIEFVDHDEARGIAVAYIAVDLIMRLARTGAAAAYSLTPDATPDTDKFMYQPGFVGAVREVPGYFSSQ